MAKRKVPHTYVIVFCIIVVAAIMTWFIKPGMYVDGKFYYEEDLPIEYQEVFQPEAQRGRCFRRFSTASCNSRKSSSSS